MKKYIAGLLTGIIIATSLTTFAAVQLKVVPNPYPVLINNAKANVQAYNINGSTYLKLADLKTAGIDAKYNKDKKQIEVKSLTSTDDSTINEPYTPDGVKLDVDHYGEGYVGIYDIGKKYSSTLNTQFKFIRIDPITKQEVEGWIEDGKALQDLPSEEVCLQLLIDGKAILSDIPYKIYNNSLGFVGIKYDFYIKSIMPILDK